MKRVAGISGLAAWGLVARHGAAALPQAVEPPGWVVIEWWLVIEVVGYDTYLL
jgi:hypothetical protein